MAETVILFPKAKVELGQHLFALDKNKPFLFVQRWGGNGMGGRGKKGGMYCFNMPLALLLRLAVAFKLPLPLRRIPKRIYKLAK